MSELRNRLHATRRTTPGVLAMIKAFHQVLGLVWICHAPLKAEATLRAVVMVLVG